MRPRFMLPFGLVRNAASTLSGATPNGKAIRRDTLRANLQDAIRIANDTPYGLVANLYTRDLARALRVAEALEAGMVGLNQGLVSNAAAPFGGIKHSGFGREGGFEGIGEYLETKYVAVAL